LFLERELFVKIRKIKRNKITSVAKTGIPAAIGLVSLDMVQAKNSDGTPVSQESAASIKDSSGLQAVASDNIDQLVASYLTDTPVDQLHAEALSGAEIGEPFPESHLLESLMARGEQFAQAETGAGVGAGVGAGAAGVGVGVGVGAGATAAGLGSAGVIGAALGGAALVSQAAGC
jgi:hypothetical protein